MSSADAAHRVPEPQGSLEVEGLGDGDGVVTEAAPVADVRRRIVGVAVAPVVQGPGVELGGQLAGEGSEDTTVEPRGVGEQQRAALAPQVVDDEADAVGRGHAEDAGVHRPMIVGGTVDAPDRRPSLDLRG